MREQGTYLKIIIIRLKKVFLKFKKIRLHIERVHHLSKNIRPHQPITRNNLVKLLNWKEKGINIMQASRQKEHATYITSTIRLSVNLPTCQTKME